MRFDLSEVNGVIRDRRTIFPEDFTDRKVHKEIIQTILTNAIWAPTHGKTQPWRFQVFTGDALKRLGKVQSELYKATTPAEKFRQGKFDKLANRPSLASVVIAVSMKRTPDTKIPELEEIEAVACAMQNMFLTCTAYGLGSFWSSGNVTYRDEMRDWLELDEDDKVLGFVYIGYTNKEWPKGHRRPLEYVTEWIDE